MPYTHVLVIDDNPAMLSLTTFHLNEAAYKVSTALSGEEGLRLLSEQYFELVLTDLQLPGLDGIELVKRGKEISPDTEFLMVTGYATLSKALEAVRAGAFYLVEKPVDYDELLVLLEKALERQAQAREITSLRERLADSRSYYSLIGQSPAMQQIYETIDSIAESDANILITGESGTGKELVANAIHYRSQRGRRPFVKINCSALPKELIESELFGHTKGAFTGAASEKTGLIARATGGTLFFDEITETPIELQSKLLRVLREQIYHPVGSEKIIPADFRLIASTHRNPKEAIQAGFLMEDLYYRINTIELRVPPLRERPEDIIYLVEHFMRQYAEKYGRTVQSISKQTQEKLLAFPWPGNVRQLQRIIEQNVIMSSGNILEIDSLDPHSHDFERRAIVAQ